MAEARFCNDQFRCAVCLELLKGPVTIPCGHSYCMSCIKRCWNQEDQKRIYSCPQCRQTFSPRPALNKNTMLAEVVEQLKKTKLSAAVPALFYAGPGDVECDVCTGRKHKAVKSCLVCLNSFCQNHIEQHENLFKGKRHNLIDATGHLQKMICRKHEKLRDIFCCTDQSCICMLCMVDEHKNHEVVSTAAERTEKQKHLGETQRKYQQQIKQRKKKLHELKEAVKNYKRSAQTAVLNSEMIFNQLINSIKRRRSEVTQMIRDQEKNEVSRAEGLMKQLEKEIDQMSLINAKLEQIPQTPDHIHFLQSYLSLPVPPGPPDVPKITERSFDIEKSVTLKSVTRLRQKLEDFCTEEIKKLSSQVRCIQIISPPGHVIKKKLFFASIKQQILEEKQYFPTQRETNYFTEERPSARSALSLGVRAVL
ncbi:hypothetical protein Q8A67_015489 [Cirrhinus molitorella]|uniref:Uncharacterized protein n=1 Tax=Cirrhinus molitorella TaxID=172907 RepID=A0AA88PLA9_9TELE|nr:hypothetical protein Q8A67_015489 [Cirrhinus molitorella]